MSTVYYHDDRPIIHWGNADQAQFYRPKPTLILPPEEAK